MNSESIKNLILSGLSDYGASLLLIMASIIFLAVGFLVFKRGWKVIVDQSLEIGGYYIENLPFKGYHRYRSEKWNSEHDNI